MMKLQKTISGSLTLDLQGFEDMGLLGTGSFGTVKLVKKKKSGRFYAVKVLSKRNLIEKGQVSHTMEEVKILK